MFFSWGVFGAGRGFRLLRVRLDEWRDQRRAKPAPVAHPAIEVPVPAADPTPAAASAAVANASK